MANDQPPTTPPTPPTPPDQPAPQTPPLPPPPGTPQYASPYGQPYAQPAGAANPLGRAQAFARQRPVVAGIAALVAVCVVCSICVGVIQGISGNSSSAGSSNTSNGGSSATHTPAGPTATNAPTATPKPSFATFGDGTYQVGKDIKPGTYRTREGSSGCYYARLKGFSGSLDDIIANNNTDSPAIVTISASDKGFESQNCDTWTTDLSQITQSKTSFDDGIFFVGTDITPGTYRNTGQTGCYWARLSNFSGGLYSIIANDNVDTATIVTIRSSDKGFESNGCGTWTKQ